MRVLVLGDGGGGGGSATGFPFIFTFVIGCGAFTRNIHLPGPKTPSSAYDNSYEGERPPIVEVSTNASHSGLSATIPTHMTAVGRSMSGNQAIAVSEICTGEPANLAVVMVSLFID